MSLSLDSITALTDMPTGKRIKVIGMCHLRSFLCWQTWLGILLAVLIGLSAQLLVRYFFPYLTTRHSPLMGFGGAVAGWLLGSHLSWKIRVNIVRRLVVRQFPGVCQSCGYDLQGNSTPYPECGSSPKSH